MILQQAIDPAVAAEIAVETDTPRRDYVHLDDVVGAIDSLRVNPRPGATFNVGSGMSYSVAEVAEIACRAAGVNKPVACRGKPRANDIPDVIADITARSGMRWARSPSITLLDGLRGIVADAGRSDR